MLEKKPVFMSRQLKYSAAGITIATMLLGVSADQVSAAETAATSSAAVSSTKPVEEPMAVKASTVTLAEVETSVQPSAVEPNANTETSVPEDNPALNVETATMESETTAVTLTKAAPAISNSPAAESVTAANAAQAATDTVRPDQMPAAAVDAAASVTDDATATPNIVRYGGDNREAVAVNVAKAHFSESSKVIIVNRDKFADAISATNVSQGEYPVLYTKAGSVDQETIALLKTMPLNEVYVLGGTVSVNNSVVAQLNAATNVNVNRIGGNDRYELNVNAVKMQYTQNDHVVIASGEIYTDALYGVSYANTIDAPVVLAKKNQLAASTVDLLKDLGAKQATLIGGTNTLAEAVETQLRNLGITVTRFAGANRYSGSAEVAKASYPEPEQVVVASGEVFSDALVSAPLAQKLAAPILLVSKDKLDAEVSQYLADSKTAIQNIYIQGGPATITASNQAAIEKAVTKTVTTDTVASGVLAIPTPYWDGTDWEYSTNQTVHPSVVQFDEDWNGYKYWMAFTPYPFADVTKENPSIVASHDGIAWEVPDGVTNPIVDYEGEFILYNSDTSLLYIPETDEMEMWYRQVQWIQDSDLLAEVIFRVKTTDGINWTSPEEMVYFESKDIIQYISPSVIYEDNVYKMWAMRDYQVFYSESPDGKNWSDAVFVKTDGMDYDTWHPSVVKIDNLYYMLNYANSDDIRYSISTDGLNFGPETIIIEPETGYSLYRASLATGSLGYYVYYGNISPEGQWSIWLATGPDLDHLVL